MTAKVNIVKIPVRVDVTIEHKGTQLGNVLSFTEDDARDIFIALKAHFEPRNHAYQQWQGGVITNPPLVTFTNEIDQRKIAESYEIG